MVARVASPVRSSIVSVAAPFATEAFAAGALAAGSTGAAGSFEAAASVSSPVATPPPGAPAEADRPPVPVFPTTARSVTAGRSAAAGAFTPTQTQPMSRMPVREKRYVASLTPSAVAAPTRRTGTSRASSAAASTPNVSPDGRAPAPSRTRTAAKAGLQKRNAPSGENTTTGCGMAASTRMASRPANTPGSGATLVEATGRDGTGSAGGASAGGASTGGTGDASRGARLSGFASPRASPAASSRAPSRVLSRAASSDVPFSLMASAPPRSRANLTADG